MRRFITALTFVCTTASGGAAAQVGGIPVHFTPVGRGVTFDLEVGRPNPEGGDGHALALRGEFRLGPVGLAPFASTQSPTTPHSPGPIYVGDQKWKGINASLSLIPGPVKLVALAGIATGLERRPGEDVRFTYIPVGIGVASRIPLGAVAVTPWFAPRAQFVNASLAIDQHDEFFAFSGGVALALPAGFRLQVAYDQIDSNDGPTSTIGLGVGYTLPTGPLSSP